MRLHQGLHRGKSVENNSWVYGYLVVVARYTQYEQIYIIPQLTSYDAIYDAGTRAVEVFPETVGEYIEMFDIYKDIICEGDILEGYNSLHSDRTIYCVKYLDNGFYYFDEDDVAWHPDNIDNVKKIGNIYDNPELVKQ